MKKIIFIAACCLLLGWWLVDYYQLNEKTEEEQVTTEAIEVSQDTLATLHPEYLPSIAIGSPAPDFAAPDTAGVIHRLSDYRGKCVILDFWASWCGDCRRETPALIALQKEFEDVKVNGADLQWIGFSFDDKDTAWRGYLRANPMPWPQVSNLKRTHQDSTFINYKLHWIPAFLLIDAEGSVAGSAITAIGLRQLLQKAAKQ